jgi:hypothetical protein
VPKGAAGNKADRATGTVLGTTLLVRTSMTVWWIERATTQLPVTRRLARYVICIILNPASHQRVMESSSDRLLRPAGLTPQGADAFGS